MGYSNRSGRRRVLPIDLLQVEPLVSEDMHVYHDAHVTCTSESRRDLRQKTR